MMIMMMIKEIVYSIKLLDCVGIVLISECSILLRMPSDKEACGQWRKVWGRKKQRYQMKLFASAFSASLNVSFALRTGRKAALLTRAPTHGLAST